VDLNVLVLWWPLILHFFTTLWRNLDYRPGGESASFTQVLECSGQLHALLDHPLMADDVCIEVNPSFFCDTKVFMYSRLLLAHVTWRTIILLTFSKAAVEMRVLTSYSQFLEYRGYIHYSVYL
jgi:hypothetical protein